MKCIICKGETRVMVDALYQPVIIPEGLMPKVRKMRQQMKSIPVCINCARWK